jgi:hypothetical protein
MFTTTTRTRLRTGAVAGLTAVLTLGAVACDDDDAEPVPTVVDELQDDPDVPFDPDVPESGDNVETDERTNQGFDVDEPGPVGNQTNPND